MPSELNVLLAIGLAAFILVTGKTVFLLNALVLNVRDYAGGFAGMTLQTFAFDPPVGWPAGWTLFFWAWWIAWASFVGLFLARISRGRTIRQFVAGTMGRLECRRAHLLGRGHRPAHDRDAHSGGVPALQNATVIMGLPFAFVMVRLHTAL